MKYYGLSRNDYKKKEVEFRNTYVGGQRYLCYVISMIVFLTFGVINLLVFCKGNEVITTKELANSLFFAILLLLSGFMATMFGLQYIKEFKEFVNKK